LPFVLIAAMAVAMMHPVLPEPGRLVIGWPSDNIQFVYIVGWMARAPLEGFSPFVDPHANLPDGLPLNATETPYLSTLALAPLSWLGGPVLGYNAQIVLAHLLSGVFAYLWVRRLTRSRLGGLVAGLAFMLAPYRAARSYGHLALVSTYPLPLFFWALDASLRPARPERRKLGLLAAATFLVSATSQYYLVICLVTGAAYGLFALSVERSAFHLARATLRRDLSAIGYRLSAIPAVVLVGAVVGALPYLSVARSGAFTPYALEEVRRWSASPLNFLMPWHLHPLWGELVGQLRPEILWGEKTLYIGAISGMLALVALLWRSNPHARVCRVWLGTALVAAVFALGTDLHTGNLPLQQEDPRWLPAYYLGQLPFVGLMRVWARFGVVTILFVALLAGVGAALVVRGRGRDGAEAPWQPRPFVVVALLAALLLDLLPGRMERFALAPRPVDAWLAQQPGNFAIGHQPHIDATMNYVALYGSLIHQKRLPAFIHERHPPQAFIRYNEASAGFPDAASVARLRALGLRFLVLEKPLFDGRRAHPWRYVAEQIAETPGLYIAADLGETVVVGWR
jgi:hypothetical protein